MLVYAMRAMPEYFATPDPRQKTFIFLSFFSLSVLFPLLGIALMRMQGLVKSVGLKTKKERIGPMILIAIFYLWLYVNIRNNPLVPPVISFFVLGSVMALFMGLFINSFSKISLHCAGAGGFVTGILFLYSRFVYQTFDILLPFSSWVFRISNDLVLIISLVIAGLIGTSRLMLGAHKNDEIYGGYLVGIISQMIGIELYF